MDIALILYHPLSNKYHLQSFNPYFNGYCSYTCINICNFYISVTVSILILMDIALIPMKIKVGMDKCELFQSLF